jgi:hypothetical protein
MLDVEKAFDKVEHHIILEMMQAKGFSPKMDTMDS